MYTTQDVSVSGLRLSPAAVLDRVERGERFTVTRDGEPVAALLSPEDAVWCAALAARFRERRPPFTQAALDAWLAEVLGLVGAGAWSPLPASCGVRLSRTTGKGM